MKIRGSVVQAVLLLSVLSSQVLTAQVTGGTILGTVSDPTGAAIPGVQLSIENVKTNVTATATTNHDGFYTVPNLIPGDYNIIANASGFAKAIING